jgi:murein DD-endopeptidase MepM/ murein hydrolase activator NlpD
MAQMQYFDPFPGNRGDELGNFASYRTQPHRGSDWGAKKGIEGKPVKAITNGRIKKKFWSDALGWTVVQSSGDGYYWLYAHLYPEPTIELNSLVEGGKTVIGQAGGNKKTSPSGTSSTGSHLHMAGTEVANGLDVHKVAFEKLVDVHKHIDANNKPVTA